MLKKKLKVPLHLIHSLFFPPKKFACLQIGPEIARNIVSIKTGMVGKNVGFSGTHRTSYTQENLNVYPHQSRITLLTLL